MVLKRRTRLAVRRSKDTHSEAVEAEGHAPAKSNTQPPRAQHKILTMQQQFGNAATQRYIQRNQAQAENEAYTLQNGRFATNAYLQAVAQGKKTLKAGSDKLAIKAVQNALLDMGYPLPRHLANGMWNAETKSAIQRFRVAHGLEGSAVFDKFALQALDQSAPEANLIDDKSVDYGRLFEDGKLTMTVGIGYDENNRHIEKTKQMQEFLRNAGFAGEMGKDGIGTYKMNKTFRYHNQADLMPVEKDVEITVRVITPSTINPKDQFGEALSQDDVTIYSGHARHGTGPDFDDKKSAAENFVIGVGSALHDAGVLKRPPGESRTWYQGHRKTEKLLKDRENDIEKMAKEGKLTPEKYRVWFFNACSSLHYLDELRNSELLGDGIDRSNLDIIGSRSPVYSEANIRVVMVFIQGLLSMQSMGEMMGGMQQQMDDYAQKLTEEFKEEDPDFLEYALKFYNKELYFMDGFADNPLFQSQ